LQKSKNNFYEWNELKGSMFKPHLLQNTCMLGSHNRSPERKKNRMRMFEKSSHMFSLTIISSSTPQTAEPIRFAIFVATLK